MAKILVGYDGSDYSRAALDTGIEVANALGDELLVVVAYEVNRFGSEVQDYAKALRDQADKRVRLATDQAAGRGAKVEVEIVEERPADALVDVAAREQARAIVIGSRGEGPLKGAIVGSTPHKLLQIAACPVLVVPEP
ncbi:MAG: universal stress protein [Solirubrobacteraceae bacterium]